MKYEIEDAGSFEGRMAANPGNGEYTLEINGKEVRLKVISMGPRGMEFLLDQKYHSARYLERSTSGIDMIIDGTPVRAGMHADLDKIVYKNSGGGGGGGPGIALRSQIPGKVVSLEVSEGDEIKKGDPVAVLESMKMQVAVKAHKDGTVKSVSIKEGGSVAKNDVIAEIE
ncbi:acetyl/propionyl-CoA carboxylase, alpha subunit [Cenarchaeum symbiosum A]|uniref:Acetyl/propionyl-CoA carboxylase, alpha subunit n=1 Tax=Cenarchaeum symbiosum (strain A) TaxID=414004 RepID=A0RY63_CENSY|nr:acetyl/propionyl-CoA carboxylase, alpha subunit [Cenarchaeum symbiosum A]